MSRDIVVITVELEGLDASRVAAIRKAVLMSVHGVLDEIDAVNADVKLRADLISKDDINRRAANRRAYVIGSAS